MGHCICLCCAVYSAAIHALKCVCLSHPEDEFRGDNNVHEAGSSRRSKATVRVYMLWCLHSRTCCCIATFLNSACAVVVVDSKVTKVRGNFVEDECYQMATEFQETHLRPDISVACR